jgi:cellulose synthase/poly-beta-1,6-N-acetylglucosamine synthase-like glycosyltransferase
MIGSVILVFQILLLMIFSYYVIISSFGWKRKKERNVLEFPIVNKFAILVAVHNEAAVIGNIVKNLKEINYPQDMYDIFVIADNCSDDTAVIARNLGAKVHERFNNTKKGKGHSLEWMFKRIFAMEEKYDAISVLDADNLVSSNYLMEMNKHLCLGHKVVQGYLDSKNPNDTWISGNNSIAFWVSNRLIQLPRYYLGLSCYLGGTGFIISTSVLKEIGWGANSLVEDLEFSLKLILHGMKVYWAHDAVIYDEKPLKLAQSWKQRKRWMQGHFDCAKRFFKDLLVKAYKEKNFAALDGVIYLTQPFIVVANGIIILSGFTYILFRIGLKLYNSGLISTLIRILEYMGGRNTLFTGIVMFGSLYFCMMFVLLENKLKSFKIFKYLLLVPIYNLTWVPIIIQGFINRNNKEWSHTLHIRALDISELERMGKAG